MTLTSLMPTLRRSVPDPININLWPEHTQVSTIDVVVSGISMLRLVEICDTPCIHTAAAVIPGTGGRASSLDQAAVIVVAVTAVLGTCDDDRIVLIDACLDRIPVVWSELRLIGRSSTAHVLRATVLADEAHGGCVPCEMNGAASLPSDVRVGDLLAIPCAAMVVLRELRSARDQQVAGERDDVNQSWLSRLG